MIDPGFQNHFHEMGFLVNSIKGGSYFGIFLFSLLAGYLIPLPEVVVLMIIGFVAKTTGIDPLLVSFLSISGAILGDNVVYWLSFSGHKSVDRFLHKMRKHKLIQYEHLVADNAGKTIFFLRLITGVRFLGPVVCGSVGIKWKEFFTFNLAATFIHSAIFLAFGWFFYKRIFLTIAEVEIVKNIVLFSSTIILGIFLGVSSAGKKSELK